MSSDLLSQVLGRRPPPFALLHRPEATGPDDMEILIGYPSEPETLADIPLSEDFTVPASSERHETLVLIPYRQIAERGFACVDDGTPMLALEVTDQSVMPVSEVLSRLPDEPVRVVRKRFEPSDDEYADLVQRVVDDEIGAGVGANFVIHRSFRAEIEQYQPAAALAFFGRLLRHETGAYWTFLIHLGGRTLVGATPERHVSLRTGVATMNPISGTYRYPWSGPTLSGLLEFLDDRKETEELYMVVDEELKMMARICDSGGRVIGPRLKEMTRLAHTEYLIEGRTERDPRNILRETMFAPTVTGSPLESACRVIRGYESAGRAFYSGVAALIARDRHGGRCMDSSIIIRTADLDASGQVRIGVGATLVRHSDPLSEVAETQAKAAALITALEGDGREPLGEHPAVRSALAQRNNDLGAFWLARDTGNGSPDPSLSGSRVLVIDAEDTFTSMIGHQLRSLGLVVTVRRFDEPHTLDAHDLVVLGPGPGDPRDATDPKISKLRSAIRTLLGRRQPFLAICLSHQVLSGELGLPVVRRAVPNQGSQREIDLFGHRETVGFYNTFCAVSSEDEIDCPSTGAVEVSRDERTCEVHALRGPSFVSFQFHAESILTRDGVGIFGRLIGEVLSARSTTIGRSR